MIARDFRWFSFLVFVFTGANACKIQSAFELSRIGVKHTSDSSFSENISDSSVRFKEAIEPYFYWYEGQELPVVEATLRIRNYSSQTQSYLVSSNKTFIEISPDSGNIGSLEEREITVRIATSANSLSIGNHDALISIQSSFGKNQTSVAIDVIEGPFAQWTNSGANRSNHHFPFGVWLPAEMYVDHPAGEKGVFEPGLDTEISYVEEYKAFGINEYRGIWQSPTNYQFQSLAEKGMPFLARHEHDFIENIDNPTMIGALLEDEPDNHPQTSTTDIYQEYISMKETDDSRPVYLNLGQGVAYPCWIGKGSEKGDWQVYLKEKQEGEKGYGSAADVHSLDVYPVSNVFHGGYNGRHELVSMGLENLKKWTENEHVGIFLEATDIKDKNSMITPAGIWTQAWMALIHGAKFISYFTHEFYEDGSNDPLAILKYPDILAKIHELIDFVMENAAVIHAPASKYNVDISVAGESPLFGDPEPKCTDSTGTPYYEPLLPSISFKTATYGDSIYVFAVRNKSAPADATIQIENLPSNAIVEVMLEGRQINQSNGQFQDQFDGYEVHLYRIYSQ